MSFLFEKKSPERPGSADQAFRRIGLLFGFLFALSFTALLWGYDGWVLSRNAAVMPWAKLYFGFPVTLVICMLTEWLVQRINLTPVTYTLWSIVSGALAYVVSYSPYLGANLFIRLQDPQFAFFPVFVYDEGATVRTVLLTIIYVMLGFMVAFVQQSAVEHSWDHLTAKGRIGLRAFAALLVCVPLAAALTLSGDGIFLSLLRNPQRNVNQLIQVTLNEGLDAVKSQNLNYNVASRYVDQFTPHYTLHYIKMFVSDTTGVASYVDAVFDNGFVMRCVADNVGVNYCDDYRKRFVGWMDDLIHAGRTGEQRWQGVPSVQRMVVSEDLLAWFTAHQDRLEADYTVRWVKQHGDIVLIEAAFENGQTLTCTMRGVETITPQTCTFDPETVAF